MERETQDLLLAPTFDGGRFASRSLPLDVVPDLIAYQTLLRELAKHIFRQQNNRKNVPPHFDEEIKLSLVGIQSGSTCLAIKRQTSDASGFLPGIEGINPYDGLLLASNDLVERVLHSADTGTGLPAEFPRHLLRHLIHLGRNLRGDERFEFRQQPGVPARVNLSSATRKKLIHLQGDKYEEHGEQRGVIRGGNAISGQLTISVDGRQIECHVSSDREVTKWLQYVGAPVVVVGMAEFSASGIVEQFRSVDSVRLTSNARALAEQFAGISRLSSDWFEDGGHNVSPELASLFRWLIEELLRRLDIPTPFVLPTPDGGIRAEWSFGDTETSLSADPDRSSVYLHTVHVRTGVDDELEVCLASREQAAITAAKFMERLFP
jgi:hypothetical protein